jgi:hypothetical protein
MQNAGERLAPRQTSTLREFFECGGKRIGKTPDRARPEFLVLRLEVEVMHAAGEVLWSFESALDNAS